MSSSLSSSPTSAQFSEPVITPVTTGSSALPTTSASATSVEGASAAAPTAYTESSDMPASTAKPAAAAETTNPYLVLGSGAESIRLDYGLRQLSTVFRKLNKADDNYVRRQSLPSQHSTHDEDTGIGRTSRHQQNLFECRHFCTFSALADFFSSAAGLLWDARIATSVAMLTVPFFPMFLGQIL